MHITRCRFLRHYNSIPTRFVLRTRRASLTHVADLLSLTVRRHPFTMRGHMRYVFRATSCFVLLGTSLINGSCDLIPVAQSRPATKLMIPDVGILPGTH